jgi:protein-ribulosamine 3-kinase
VSDWSFIAGQIAAAAGEPFDPAPPRNVGGGCINTAVVLSDDQHSYFVKLNRKSLLPMFEAELAGLAEMVATDTIRVPRPLCTGCAGAQSFIAMEHIPMGGRNSDGSARAGRELAAMHRTTRPDFGWDRDNTIGSTPQPNEPDSDWIDFWRRHRLGFQLDLAARNGYGGRLQRLGERLLADFPALIDHDPSPSLLHGDLWGGNMAFDREGGPVIFDPAVYYGDREADLAMTELFGGFDTAFYAAYREVWPLGAGYGTRKTLYNLYHILNHLNLFGSGYLAQAEGMMERLLSQLH